MSDRYVVTIPIRFSRADEAVALRRLRTAQRIGNEVLSEMLSRHAAYVRDPDYRRLREERKRAQKYAGKGTKLGATDAPSARRETDHFFFADASERNAAWTALQERHGLLRERPVERYTPAGRAWYERTKALIKTITARQTALGPYGLDAATIWHEIAGPAMERVVDGYMSGRTGRPRYASRRHPIVSVSGSSSAKNSGALRVDLELRTFTWKAARGRAEIAAELLIDEHDAWLRRALRVGTIAQVRVLTRTINGKRRWYVQLVMAGARPLNPRIRLGTGTVGVDVGSRHIAAVGEERAFLERLAPTAVAREAARDATEPSTIDRRKGDRYVRRMQRINSQRIARASRSRRAERSRSKKISQTTAGRGLVGHAVAATRSTIER